MLPKGCPPEFGEDAWGYVGGLARNLLAVASEVKDCFRSISDSGSSSLIPPMSAKCNEGPARKCERVATAAEITRPWQYALPTAEEDPAWHRVEVEDEYYWDTTASTHIRFSWSNEGGECEVWFEGFADLDGDEFYSTYLIGTYYESDGSLRDSLSRRELFPESPEKRAQRALAE
jgi:hypothetical protein